ncbi:hypothetical protein NYR68_01815 [Actinobacillus equuli subsp. haemolyticus]|uniref:hypothetical protein n=1 Tax=Actinobacillus equuli TaxID=718 RepID=UPI0024466E75|nr:hypothetical protein [Actinobacillus equuli]WGE51150.1 hypothetical protein NYR68_01815 [Actinobacillus equuli subsp. haemolyticus]
MAFHINKIGQFNNINEAHFHQVEKEIDKTCPHVVTCPQCGGESYRFNEYCNNGKCTFGIKAYFDNQERLEKEQRRKALLQKQSQKLAIFTIIGFVLCLSGLFLGSKYPLGYVLFFAAGLLALIFNKAEQHIEQEIRNIE